VAIIRRGEVVEVAETGTLIDRAVRRARVRFKQPVGDDIFAGLPGVAVLARDGETSYLLQVEGEMDTLIKTLAAFPVSDLATERPSLEEIFLEYYESDAKEPSVLRTV
ncbi:MAG TPA: DUF4162 domain-containing protein, partial [Ardenticatenaceae bacterium]|nr:DUF4162 domain-containing protein [Ardenticatenaceae bacterium]